MQYIIVSIGLSRSAIEDVNYSNKCGLTKLFCVFHVFAFGFNTPVSLHLIVFTFHLIIKTYCSIN